ncbi:hypothetical protein ONE63_003983 [Megalurothrips usitatus]|uniref:C2H2-type domain-containing protein n=1 Tax=Megalurothrips usitatus TaxID=439358 RepID=A0AAV7X4R5_9NEOP|nr:hypothetical protein ONE63_003983 [Megalurothrips usitatus]
MHRFAINALKVQDHLSKMSQELPMTAINICKTFMTTYVHEPVLMNETVASLTNQEVTEMEVQVDPMVFLEDDQIDETEQENGCGEADEDATTHLPQNGDHDIVKEESNNDTVVVGSNDLIQQTSTMPEEKKEIEGDNTSNKNERADATSCELENLPSKSEENLQQNVDNSQQLTLPEVKMLNESSEPNSDVVTAPTDKEDSKIEEETTTEPSIFRRSRKGVVKNSKKSEVRSPSSENIKCTTYTCPICKKVFLKRGPFKAHLETHKTDQKFACEICLRVFKKENNLTQHKKSHAEQTTFPCSHCNRVYPTMSTLRSHLVSHSDERPHVCSICSKSFKRNQDLKFHLNQHNGLRPYHCPYCTKSFSSSGNCFSHRRRAHLLEIERDRALQKSATTAN